MNDTVTPNSTSMQRRAALAGFAASTIELYDFLLYSTMAALVFNEVFFPTYSSGAGLLASFATLAVGFLARPLGSILLGRLGDRIGRQRTLVFSLSLMAAASLGIGVLPTYEQIGVFAPLLLVIFRMLQGLALGGEWAGAALTLVEHAKPGRRYMMGSIVQMGAFGIVLATLATSISSSISGDNFLTWGWRLPFLFSIVLFGLTYWIRRQITDSAEFVKAKSVATTKPSLGSILRNHWRPIALGTGVAAAGNVVYYTISTFGLSYAVNDGGLPRTSVLNALMIASVIYTACIGGAGWFADKFGPRAVLLTGITAAVVISTFFFTLLDQGSVVIVGIAFTLYLALAHAPIQAPQAGVFSDQFPPLARYTGVALTQALPTTIIGGTAPFVAQLLMNTTGSTWAITGYIVVVSVVAFACTFALTRASKWKSVKAEASNPTTHAR
ncbi:MFS transporter [Rhodococcoides kyotonense]|uniref:Predicted arabinose efflux permease, MFS family n=1 Tax=Rhodococcoides kyotonense TaxID=398843 RepID=A0A239M2D3_9NOCA|nr:MFS transporter [Rhodococcus kyotonensis]SNT36243.1 Predicted arabinose efflux permease, MFS family [Rhodococcus kyotonensis]